MVDGLLREMIDDAVPPDRVLNYFMIGNSDWSLVHDSPSLMVLASFQQATGVAVVARCEGSELCDRLRSRGAVTSLGVDGVRLGLALQNVTVRSHKYDRSGRCEMVSLTVQ